ncbi:MAG: FAD-binding protein [Prolixibacteraceae bacterium]|jgi:FAD/FMN-containing dehydrogenase/Fe-S oxidoreductase|nr:FAD-binding protein [Prolixibacteraceae bacterium]
MIDFSTLKQELEGDLLTDESTLILYSTDASAYKERPVAVVFPKHKDDILRVILFCNQHNLGIIPRTAGTSLAGQVVGSGVVVDLSRTMTQILEVNKPESWVRLQPGVVLDELNIHLRQFGLFFGPETSTSNRCMIGGMVGNNACGAHSLIFGSTRDHLLEVTGYLSDSSEVTFKPLSYREFKDKTVGDRLENSLYRQIETMLSDPKNQEQIEKEYPEKALRRRNTGYALDELLHTELFSDSTSRFNFSKLIAGSEGTLLFVTEIKLNLVPLPPKETGLVCIHFHSLEEAMEGNLLALKYNPGAIELIDDVILKCTLDSIEQRKNRFFVEGEPAAILILEWARETKEEIASLHHALESELKAAGFGYHFPLVTGEDTKKVWALRKAGLGLLSNIPGDAKPVSLVEDTAVDPRVLSNYIAEFKEIMAAHGLSCVYHAHIATGELHLRPVINLKDPEGVVLFRTIATKIAHLVKKYRGSLSGEHGDGRLRGEFIPVILGSHNFELIKQVKQLWDPKNIFNPGKIVNTPPMDSSLRIHPGENDPAIETFFDWSDSMGFVRHVEKCNGSGDCRKSEIIGGTMCPSYMATRDERHTTRARANLLNDYLRSRTSKEVFESKELYDILDLCISCKGCKSECPSGVDMTRIKAEFLQHKYDQQGSPLRSKLVANIASIYKLGTPLPSLFNFMVHNPVTSSLIKSVTGFAGKRSIPGLARTTLRSWCSKNLKKLNDRIENPKGSLYFFIDEFTNYNDTEIGIKAIRVLNHLGYLVLVAQHEVSGRTFLSKGYVRKAAKIAANNVAIFESLIDNQHPLVGIEPSAILTFRDEYPDLLRGEQKIAAKKIAKNSLMIDEFLVREQQRGNISADSFTKNELTIKLHGHCQQKAIASTLPTKKMLSMPVNYHVQEIPSGCCGMAGSFGYEKEHYDLSMKIGNLVLFPELRRLSAEVVVAAPGTSCRHHILDGTGKKAVHPVEILFEAIGF